MLRVYNQEQQLIYENQGKWLHPLLALEEFLEGNGHSRETLHLHDSIIGRAAALLIVGLGIKRCHGDLMSRRALPVLEEGGVVFSYSNLVDRIECRTEELLKEEASPERARQFILSRIEETKNGR